MDWNLILLGALTLVCASTWFGMILLGYQLIKAPPKLHGGLVSATLAFITTSALWFVWIYRAHKTRR